MAQYTVTHTCGHEQVHQLFGAGRERKNRLEWLATTLCAECYKAQRASEPAEVYIRPIQGGAQVIVLNAQSVKDTLKARGYRFDRFAVGPGANNLDKMALSGGNPGWAKSVSPDVLPQELAWCEAQGMCLKSALSDLHSLVAAPIEGRPELAGIDNDYADPVATSATPDVVEVEIGEVALPDLTGSPKQIEWASKIRLEMLAQARKVALPAEAIEDYIYAVRAMLRCVKSASFWIDHRRDTPLQAALAVKWGEASPKARAAQEALRSFVG